MFSKSSANICLPSPKLCGFHDRVLTIQRTLDAHPDSKLDFQDAEGALKKNCAGWRQGAAQGGLAE